MYKQLHLNQNILYVMKKIFIFLSICLGSGFFADLGAQVTKVPSYGIQKIYDRGSDYYDTTAKNSIGLSLFRVDSIRYFYNEKYQLVFEKLYRIQYRTFDGLVLEDFHGDTARYYRIHKYDSKGRKTSTRHGQVFGAPNDIFCFFIKGCLYESYIVRLDSNFYDDAHGGIQHFSRRYEVRNPSQVANYLTRDTASKNMVIKNPDIATEGFGFYQNFELGYEFDALGRITRAIRYIWSNNYKFIDKTSANGNPDYLISYIGNTNKILKRVNHTGNARTWIDTLFAQDSFGRILSCQSKLIDSTNNPIKYYYYNWVTGGLYLPHNMGYQIKNYGVCIGRKNYPNGRLFYTFTGDPNGQLNLCSNRPGGGVATINKVNHYMLDSEGNVLAADSSGIQQFNFADGYDFASANNIGYHCFDSTAFFDFKSIVVLDSKETMKQEFLDFQYWPNPTTNTLSIKGGILSGNISLFGIDGKLWFSKMREFNQENISLPPLPEGLYLLEVGGIRKKLLIQQPH